MRANYFTCWPISGATSGVQSRINPAAQDFVS
jgi:hypothetical protein